MVLLVGGFDAGWWESFFYSAFLCSKIVLPCYFFENVVASLKN